jgi:2-dehydro-3-deoxyphosphogluconate aldolase/(4S)-4-hydroxy-2-oxoglutarate aldolase
LEVTLRTPAALDVIAAMAEVEGGVVGAGTLVTPDDVVAAKAVGAQFGVSPGSTDALIAICEAEELPLLPGAATATEAMALYERGYDMLKFFPAEASGGAAMLKAIGAPLPQISFCPTGGVSPENAESYLSLPNVICAGGSWVAPKDLVEAGDWSAIKALARAAASLPR